MYTIELSATKNWSNGSAIYTSVRFAGEGADLITIAADFAREEFPPTDGWYDHKWEVRTWTKPFQEAVSGFKKILDKSAELRDAANGYAQACKDYDDGKIDDNQYEAALYKLKQKAMNYSE